MKLRHGTLLIATIMFMAACAPDDAEPVPKETVENRHLNILYWHYILTQLWNTCPSHYRNASLFINIWRYIC